MPKRYLRSIVLTGLAIATGVLTVLLSGHEWGRPLPAAATTGPYLAALDHFSVENNGFNFENYGGENDRTNLTAAELERMFGPQVCASKAGGKCLLTPPAQEWMEQINTSMNGGHCEGMAALSLLFYHGEVKPEEFGGAEAGALAIDQNEALQREIAYWFSTQYTSPTSQAETKITPNEVLDTLIKSFQDGKDTYTFGIYKPNTPLDGHAMTPWAVEDRGSGLFAVKIYDNNYPGVEREVLIDRNQNTWSYTASTNPSEAESEYTGDAETKSLTLAPTSVRLQPQECPFCEEDTATKSAQKTPNINYNEIWLEGAGDLLITDAQGRRYGVLNRKLVKEIPGVHSVNIKSGDLWKSDQEPVYYVPQGMPFTLTLDGSRVKTETESAITIIGPGYDLGVDEIKLDPQQRDSLTLAASGTELSYTTQGDESPTLSLGFEGKTADYDFALKGVDLVGGGVINISLEEEKGRISLNTKGNKSPGTYAILMHRIDDQGEQTFSHDGVELDPNDTVYLDYSQWTGDGGTLALQIDRGSRGTIAKTVQLTDEAK